MADTLAIQLVYNSTLTALGATDQLWFQCSGAFAYGATGAIVAGAYNDGMHPINSSNAQLDGSSAAHNIKYVDSSHYSLDGGASTSLDATHPATASCLNAHATFSPNGQVTAASFYVDDGSTPTNAPTGLTCVGVQQSQTAWAACGGSGAAVALATAASASSYDAYFALSVSPTTRGAKTGRLTVQMTVV